MSRFSKFQFGFGALEIGLLLAVGALVFQCFPSLWWCLWSAFDVRTWSPSVWFALNIFILLGLFVIRFKRDLYSAWQARRERPRNGDRRQSTSGVGDPYTDPDYEARVRRDAEWRERAKKRLPWHS